MNIYLKSVSWVLFMHLFSVTVSAEALTSTAARSLQSYNEVKIDLESTKLIHWVFIDIWNSYEGGGDEELVSQLPSSFQGRVQRIWVQPEINVTPAQLRDFQLAYPQVTPLVLDHAYHLMQKHKVWQSPYHILVEKGGAIFRGTGEELKQYVERHFKTERKLL